MMLYLFPFLAIVIGAVIGLTLKDKYNLKIKLLLSFSGAFLLAITLFELLPQVYNQLNAKLTGILIMAGIVLQLVLESFSKGAEHGHIHVEKQQKTFPWLLFISLCIHSILEGFPIDDHNDMVYGIIIHKIPIAILVSAYLVQSGFKNFSYITFITLFAVMTPFGTYLSQEASFLSNYIHYINAIVIGIFFHIATVILFESSHGHKFNNTKLVSILLGVLVAYFI
ncbi:MAG: ZIP family metal transporter [Winogradskyella sp.]|nr:ZIP family metal transporter [Winogradskyella sp.]NNC46171.1 ZIP family metal transporter [Winogradskyella sp.]NNF86850.1 ZIP family metal transporter [Winogradskyella sp.]NNK39077.1 ZIP family metal transporter [Winogradskyella sp.]NNL83640.1 ZIP family metal transporter [Winogradskyella sp.]